MGNFDHVFASAYERAYLPFIEVLERFPAVHATLHYSGPLLDWFLAERPVFLERVAALAASGQVEIMGGGYYEPLLCAIPERDAIAQIRRMTDFCREHFHGAPTGMWVTERVWEPAMAGVLAAAGIQYTALDDTHFLCAGIDPGELFGYFVTEDDGRALSVFPILERLRYTIPFHPVQETLDFLEAHATEDGTRCAVIHDDGEKFGVWPGTHSSVYGEGWLEAFFKALTDNREWLRCETYAEYIERARPRGRVYLPCASYEEMMAWALPPDVQQRLKHFREWVDSAPEWARDRKSFVRGGFWRQFLAKYPEANNIHKRMLRVSRRLETIVDGNRSHDPRTADGERLLHEGQCNCAYWHGQFGGLYLNHLRSALYEKLVEADGLLDQIEGRGSQWTSCEAFDFDADGRDEVCLENSRLTLMFAPADGGTLFEWDYKDKPFNLCNTLARRPEAYHDDLRKQASQAAVDAQSGRLSIHEIEGGKEPGLEAFLVYDPYRRCCLRDHFLDDGVRVEELWAGAYAELGDFATGEYLVERTETSVQMRRTGRVAAASLCDVCLMKTVRLEPCASGFEILYDIHNTSDNVLRALFGVELTINFLAGAAPDRYYRSEDRKLNAARLGVMGCDEGLRHIALHDDWRGLACSFRFDELAKVFRFPIETVSQSEGGQERVYQTSVVLPCWAIDCAPGARARRTIVAETMSTK